MRRSGPLPELTANPLAAPELAASLANETRALPRNLVDANHLIDGGSPIGNLPDR